MRNPDLEQRLDDAIDDASPVELFGIHWYAEGGEATPRAAEWSSNWSELLADIDGEPWQLQTIVFASLGRLRHEPQEGHPVDPTLSIALHAWFSERITEALEEAAL